MDQKEWKKLLHENKLNEESKIKSQMKSMVDSFYKNVAKQAESLDKKLRGKEIKYKKKLYRIDSVNFHRRGDSDLSGLYALIINVNDRLDGFTLNIEKLYR